MVSLADDREAFIVHILVFDPNCGAFTPIVEKRGHTSSIQAVDFTVTIWTDPAIDMIAACHRHDCIDGDRALTTCRARGPTEILTLALVVPF